MRQAGALAKQFDAERFAAFLVTLGIGAHAEQEGDEWAIWVRDEDQLDQAKTELDQFQAEPSADRYQGAELKAQAIQQDEVKRREKMRENVVQVGSKWRQGGARKAPLVFTLIALSVGASLWTNWGLNATADQLSFCSLKTLRASSFEAGSQLAALADISRGQLWRLVTPIFMHGNLMHIAFNMYMLYYFGMQIEDRQSTVRLALLVLVIAVVSNVAQALLETPHFVGMSGVVYGLFGYIWMKTLYEPSAGLFVSQGTIIWLVVWFFLCLSGVIPRVANTAHFAGLAMGLAIGYAPVLLKTMNSR